MEVRVGFKKPFKPGADSYEAYDYNRVCGIIPGPGIPSTITTFTCVGIFFSIVMTIQVHKVAQKILPRGSSYFTGEGDWKQKYHLLKRTTK